MFSEPTYEYTELLQIIPTATREELSGITETIRKQMDLYNAHAFNLVVRAIGKRIIELGAPIPA